MKKFILCFLLMASCKSAPKTPPGILDQNSMINVLIDIHVAEAQANSAGLRSQDSVQVYYKVLEKDVFGKYGIDSTRYYDSYRYYMENIKQMDQIYAAVVDSLSLRENSIK